MYSSGVRCKQVDIFIYIVEFFQSTHSEECDNGSLWQSIATHCFNPRTPKGATYKPDSVLYFFMFQPTHPWRVRRYLSYSYIYLYMFQSTHPWRVRRFFKQPLPIFAGFQSTHPWRVRRLIHTSERRHQWFQSTHPWRVRRVRALRVVAAHGVSIHAPMKGATRRLPVSIGQAVFQSTHPWRVRR